MATCESAGTTSRRSWSRLPSRSGAIELNPVRLPPGRARLGTRPVPTGSPTATMTSGTTVVAFFTASDAGVPAVTITSTLSAIRSRTSPGNLSYLPSAQRNSMLILRPSSYPSSRKPARNASTRLASNVAVELPMKPMRGILGSARAASGHAAAALRSTMKSRRCMCPSEDQASLQKPSTL